MPKIKSEYDDLDKYKYSNEDIIYCKKNTNLRHNPYGPAVIFKNRSIIYYIENEYHRLDGPAIIWSSGEEDYYINNKRLSKEEFKVHPERLKFIGKGYLICLK